MVSLLRGLLLLLNNLWLLNFVLFLFFSLFIFLCFMIMFTFFHTFRLAFVRGWLTIALIKRMTSLLVFLTLLGLLAAFLFILVNLIILIEFIRLINEHCLFYWGSSRISNRYIIFILSLCTQVGQSILTRDLHPYGLSFLAWSSRHWRLLLHDSTRGHILFLRISAELGLLLMQYFAALHFRLRRWFSWTVAHSRIAC